MGTMAMSKDGKPNKNVPRRPARPHARSVGQPPAPSHTHDETNHETRQSSESNVSAMSVETPYRSRANTAASGVPRKSLAPSPPSLKDESCLAPSDSFSFN